MKYCIRCVYPETKPNLWFNEAGLCSACIAYEERQKIDWAARAQEFADRFKPGTRVVVGCSGGKDSTYIIVKLKEHGLNPVAVTATTDHLSKIGRMNLENIGDLCDHITVTANQELRRRVARYALETVGDVSWCEHVLIWTIPARVAAGLGIKDVFYGENPQNEYGAGPRESQQLAAMPPQWEQEFGGLLGLRVSDIIEEFVGKHRLYNGYYDVHDFDFYKMPDRLPTRHFLGYYFSWDGLANTDIAVINGFRRHDRIVEGSLCDYENLDNYQTGIHDYLRYVKYGYLRAHDIAGNWIRRGIFTRQEAVEQVRRVEPFPRTYLHKGLPSILGNIDMTMSEFMEIVIRFTNKKLFYIGNDGVPRLTVEAAL